MGRIEIDIQQNIKESKENISRDYRCILDQIKIDSIIQNLVQSNLVTGERDCYLYGFGSQTKRFYRKLKQKASLRTYELKWFGYGGPANYRFLSYIAASTSGLIKIFDPKIIEELFPHLCRQAMGGILSISNIYSKVFEEYVTSTAGKVQVEPIEFITQDDSSAALVIDGDSINEERGGFLSRLLICHKAPDIFFKLHEFTEQRW